MIQNSWLTLALHAGCIQGFFLVYLLWRKKDSNRQAIRYFNALLLTVAILMLLRVSYQPAFFKQFAEIILLPDVILFLAGPYIFLFTRALLQLDPLTGIRFWGHFIPAFVHVLIINTFLGLHLKGLLHFLHMGQIMVAFNLIEIAVMASLGIYLAISFRLYQRYKVAFYQKYAVPFIGQFLRSFFAICFGLLAFWLFGFLIKVLRHQPDYSVYTLFWVLLVATFYFLAYKILSTPDILALPKMQEQASDKHLEEPVEPAIIEALQQLMLQEKPYLNPEIKIADLAESMELPKHQLSRVINQGFGKNFFDFVNGYRIQAFINARKDKKQAHLNTLELAYSAGFNSKSAFNRAFLKETGSSPRQYFEQPRQAASAH